MHHWPRVCNVKESGSRSTRQISWNSSRSSVTLNDMRHCDKFLHTGSLESFHSAILKDLPKSSAFKMDTQIVMTMKIYGILNQWGRILLLLWSTTSEITIIAHLTSPLSYGNLFHKVDKPTNDVLVAEDISRMTGKESWFLSILFQ